MEYISSFPVAASANTSGQISPEGVGLLDKDYCPIALTVMSEAFYRAVSRAGALPELKNYEKLRKFFSLQDLAVFIAMNRLSFISKYIYPSQGGESFGTSIGEFWGWDSDKSTLSKESMIEITATLMPLSESKEITDIAYESLRKVESSLEDVAVDSTFPPPGHAEKEEDLPYKVVVVKQTVYIVVKEGFLSHVERPRARLAFLVNSLRGLYSTHAVNSVNRHPLYRQYVKALFSKAGA